MVALTIEYSTVILNENKILKYKRISADVSRVA